MYKELSKPNSRGEKKAQFKKWAKDLRTHFTKEDICMANKHIEEMLNRRWLGYYLLILHSNCRSGVFPQNTFIGLDAWIMVSKSLR